MAVSALAVAAGCGSPDRTDRDTSQRDPVLEHCARKIDSQIEAGRIPEADREYATGMCLRVP